MLHCTTVTLMPRATTRTDRDHTHAHVMMATLGMDSIVRVSKGPFKKYVIRLGGRGVGQRDDRV